MSSETRWHQALWLEGAEAKSDGWHEDSEAIARALDFGIQTEREARLVLLVVGYHPDRIDKVFAAGDAVFGNQEAP